MYSGASQNAGHADASMLRGDPSHGLPVQVAHAPAESSRRMGRTALSTCPPRLSSGLHLSLGFEFQPEL